MGESEHNSVATAIRSAEFEGFLAGTLFNQGWSVTLRALDIDSLLSYIDSNPTALSLLLISTDVEGLTPESIREIEKRGIKYFLFAATQSASELYPESVTQPPQHLNFWDLLEGRYVLH